MSAAPQRDDNQVAEMQEAMESLHVHQTLLQQKLARMLAKQAHEALKKEINGQLMGQLQAQRAAFIKQGELPRGHAA
jgi:hypothetical protein